MYLGLDGMSDGRQCRLINGMAADLRLWGKEWKDSFNDTLKTVCPQGWLVLTQEPFCRTSIYKPHEFPVFQRWGGPGSVLATQLFPLEAARVELAYALTAIHERHATYASAGVSAGYTEPPVTILLNGNPKLGVVPRDLCDQIFEPEVDLY